VRHHRLFVACYGVEAVKPKHHRALHFGSMLESFGTLLATFVHERRHKHYKELAMAVKVGQRFESSVMSAMLIRQANGVQDEMQFAAGTFGMGSAEVNATMLESIGPGPWQFHRAVNVDGTVISMNNVAFLKGSPPQAIIGKSLARKADDSTSYLAVVEVLAKRGTKWYPGSLALVNMTSVRVSTVWSRSSDGGLVVLATGDMMWTA